MGNLSDDEWPEDDRSPVEKVLTMIAYRPKTKTWEPSLMEEVKNFRAMRLRGEETPDPFAGEDDPNSLFAYRKRQREKKQ